ncbi:MAG: OmpA family protein [Treponemataceae bacterium]|nr:OmpA family protein [Treponemataceae bacterium]
MNERCPKCSNLLIKSNIIKELISIDAENSALKVRDRILEIDKIPVENYQSFKERKVSGALASVKVLRNKDEILFLVPDKERFFTDEIDYEMICPVCSKTKSKKIPKTKILITAIIVFLSIALITTFLTFFTSRKFAPLSKPDNVILELEDTIKTQEIEETDYTSRIKKLIREGNLKDDQLLALALKSNDFKLFDSVESGKYQWRKMFTLPKQFQVLNTIVSGYKTQDLEAERLEIISRLRCQAIGTVYFDYGEWLAPSPKYPDRSVIEFGPHEYDDKRLYETAAALANILALIPETFYQDAFFIIDGHTDSISAHSFNQALSERRALYLKYIMTDVFGIPADKVITKGFSYDKKDVDPEKLKTDFARNRRCVIQVCFFKD